MFSKKLRKRFGTFRKTSIFAATNETIMGKIEEDILYFVSFCIEQYKMYKGLSGGDTMTLFDKKGVTNYLVNHFDVLHTQSAQWLVQEIDDYITKQ